MEIDDKENVMENLQAVIDRNMKDAQTIWAAPKDKDMQEMAIQDAVDAFAIKSFIEGNMIEKAVEHFSGLDTSPMEDIAVALVKDMGQNWTEETFGIELRI